MLKISANQNLPDGSLGHGNPLEQIWWYTKSWWHLAKFTAWVMPPCLAHWACLALCLASCTLSWPHLHMAWGHACYQWPGMTPLAVDECVMKESCLALTMGAPPACPGCCEKHPIKSLGHCNLSRTIAKSQQKISAIGSPYYQTLASLSKHLKSLKGIGCMEMESFEPT